MYFSAHVDNKYRIVIISGMEYKSRSTLLLGISFLSLSRYTKGLVVFQNFH